MMIGHVRVGFPRLTLQVQGDSSDDEIEFIVDTGFNGDITLPSNVIARLDAKPAGQRPVAMADGSVGVRPIFRVLLMWEEEERAVEAISVGVVPLLGVGLLAGCSLTIEMVEGGEVVIESE